MIASRTEQVVVTGASHLGYIRAITLGDLADAAEDLGTEWRGAFVRPYCEDDSGRLTEVVVERRPE